MTDEHAELREAIGDLRGDFREAVAMIRGSIDTLTAAKEGEVHDLSRQVSEVRNDHKSTKTVVAALHDRLDQYPRPEQIEASFSAHADHIEEAHSLARANQLTLAKLAVPGAIGAAIFAAIVEGISRIG